MTVHRKTQILIAAFACANLALALWGGKHIFSGLYEPVFRSFGA